MTKRYRRPKLQPGEIRASYASQSGDPPDLIVSYEQVPIADVNLVMNTFCAEQNHFNSPGFDPAFIKELEARGYDLDTLQFSIKKKSGVRI